MSSNPDGSAFAESPLVAQFSDFCGELIRLKNMAAHEGRGGGAAAAGLVKQINDRLFDRLLRHATAASGRGLDSERTFAEARYLMAALADEMFLNLDWGGREDWEQNLLELRLFNSYEAGEQVFDNLERLLNERDPRSMEMAVLYLEALALGFRGKYRGGTGEERIDSYRQQLFMFVYGREPQLDAGGRQLFPNALAHPFEGAGEKRKLPPVRTWQLILVGIVAAQIVVGGIIWASRTGEVKDQLRKIDELGESLEAVEQE